MDMRTSSISCISLASPISGLATRLLSAALVEARGRGCTTSSLQSSAMGERIYDTLGYRRWFRLDMYERRRPA